MKPEKDALNSKKWNLLIPDEQIKKDSLGFDNRVYIFHFNIVLF